MQVFRMYIAIGLLIGLASCTMIGTGTRTVIKAPVEGISANTEADDCERFILQKYPELLFRSDRDDVEYVVIIDPTGRSKGAVESKFPRSEEYSEFADYMEAKYGDSGFEAAGLTFSLRNRDRIPPFLPVDTLANISKTVATIITSESKLTEEERIAQQRLLEARLLNVPDLPLRATLHHVDEKGRRIYYYYPRLEMDFSSNLLSATSLDRFSFLAVVVRLHNQDVQVGVERDQGSTKASGFNKAELRPRFIDFTPKAADFAEFTRGQLTQTAELAAHAGYTAGRSSKVVGIATGDIELTRSLTPTAEVTYTYTDALVRELKDSIERQTTGLLDQGRIFFAEYRSIRAVRIGGTYSFDLMLQVPALGIDVEEPAGQYECAPVVTKIFADVYLLGVVRHVYNRGKTGLFFRVPETENDDVYEQVVLKIYKDQKIWEYNNKPWTGKVKTEKLGFNLVVFTNREDAIFVVKRELIDKKTGKKISEVIGEGSGKKQEIVLPLGDETPYQAVVEFFPVVDTTPKHGPVVLEVKSTDKFQVPSKKTAEKGEKRFVTGNYLPK